MSERNNPLELAEQARIALEVSDPTRIISATRETDSGRTVRIFGQAVDYHPRPEIGLTVGETDPETGRPKHSL